MLHLKQLSCHNLYLPVLLILTFIMGPLWKMLIPHENGHFCPEVDRNEQLLTY